MGSLKKHNRLEDLVRLLVAHKKEIEELMPLSHAINKYKDHKKKGLIISTGELCVIFALSSHPVAKKFCFAFGMESGTEEEFTNMLSKLNDSGFSRVANELRKRRSYPYIDIQHSTNLLRSDSNRDTSNPYIYADYGFFSNYQFLTGKARGYSIDWAMLKKAVQNLDWQSGARGRETERNTVKQSTTKRSNSKIENWSDLLAKTSEFDPKSEAEARDRVLRSIAVRRGQKKFRDALIEAYKGKCAITGCDCEEALEAAHILPYKGEYWNHPANGLLLRADIHTLFDAHLISLSPDTHAVTISANLKDTTYGELDGRQGTVPDNDSLKPNDEALSKHIKELKSGNID